MNILLSLIKRFIKAQQGVYAIVMGLVSFILLSIIAISVDGTGLLLDKARLSDASEQAALALVAENNQHRDDQFKLTKSSYRTRDKEIIDGYVRAFMENEAGENSKPAFDYTCQQTSINETGKRVKCEIWGTTERASWLPLSVSRKVIIPAAANVGGSSKAVKETTDEVVESDKPQEVVKEAPQDVVVVADYSIGALTSSFYHPRIQCRTVAPNFSNMTKFEKVRVRYKCGESFYKVVTSTLSEVANKVLNPPSSSESLKYNRLAVVPFAFGAQIIGDKDYCTLPFSGTDADYFDPEYEYFRSSTYYIRQGKRVSLVRDIKKAAADFSAAALNEDEGYHADTIYRYLPRYVNIQKTIDDIKDIEKMTPKTANSVGKMELRVRKSFICLPTNYTVFGNRASEISTKAWFEVGKKDEFDRFMRTVNPGGSRLSSAGLLVGFRTMMDINSKPASEIKANTQRILIVLLTGKDYILDDNTRKYYRTSGYINGLKKRTISSGSDKDSWSAMNWVRQNRSERYPFTDQGGSNDFITVTPTKRAGKYATLTEDLVTAGMCGAIRKRLDDLQDPNFPTVKSKIVAIYLRTTEGEAEEGYINKKKLEEEELAKVWRSCVGEGNFYSVNDKNALSKALQKAIIPGKLEPVKLKNSIRKFEEVGKNTVQ